eukprot:5306497-Prymnesium_polylepis.1
MSSLNSCREGAQRADLLHARNARLSKSTKASAMRTNSPVTSYRLGGKPQCNAQMEGSQRRASRTESRSRCGIGSNCSQVSVNGGLS